MTIDEGDWKLEVCGFALSLDGPFYKCAVPMPMFWAWVGALTVAIEHGPRPPKPPRHLAIVR
jgi:hypothetical protein